MSRVLIWIFCLAFAVSQPRTVHAEDEPISFRFFYDSLSPQGDWLEVGDYGLCWRPSGLNDDWAPYTDGYWAYTDAGWTWVSYEEFGSITYHYGRWVIVEDEGWVWVPDYEWGPAWVSWRHSDNHVGWAPLPPEARWEPEVGFSIWVDRDYDIAPPCYNFVQVQDFGVPVLSGVICRRADNVTMINQTVNITNISYHNTVIFNGGPSYDHLRSRCRRDIPALRLIRAGSHPNHSWDRDHDRGRGGDRYRPFLPRAEQQGNCLTVYAPRVVRKELQLNERPKAVKIVGQSKVTKGWKGIDEGQRTLLRRRMDDETRGARASNAPARAPKESDLKVVRDLKIDPQGPRRGATVGVKAGTDTGSPRGTGGPDDRRPGTRPANLPSGAPAIVKSDRGSGSERTYDGEKGNGRGRGNEVRPPVTVPSTQNPGVAVRPGTPERPSTRPDVNDRRKTSEVESVRERQATIARQEAAELARQRAELDAEKQKSADRARQRAEQQTAKERDAQIAAQRAQDAARQRDMEDSRLRKDTEARQQAAEIARQRAQEEGMKQQNRVTESDRQRGQDDDARQQAAENARQRAQQDAARQQAAENGRQRAMQEAAKQQAAENARQRAQQDAARQQAAEMGRQRAQQEAAKQQAAENARQRAQQDAARQQAAEMGRQRAQQEAAKQQAAENARQRAQQEAAKQQAAENARQRAQQDAARQQAAENARQRAQQDASRQQAAEAARQQAAQRANARQQEARSGEATPGPGSSRRSR